MLRCLPRKGHPDRGDDIDVTRLDTQPSAGDRGAVFEAQLGDARAKLLLCLNNIATCAEKKGLKESSRSHLIRETQLSKQAVEEKLDQVIQLSRAVQSGPSALPPAALPWDAPVRRLHLDLDRAGANVHRLSRTFKLINRDTFFTTELLSCVRQLDKAINAFQRHAVDLFHHVAGVPLAPAAEGTVPNVARPIWDLPGGSKAEPEEERPVTGAVFSQSLHRSPLPPRTRPSHHRPSAAASPHTGPRASHHRNVSWASAVPSTRMAPAPASVGAPEPRSRRGLSGAWDAEADALSLEAEAGNMEALLKLGTCLFRGERGLRMDRGKARECLEKAAEGGHPDALYWVALLTYHDSPHPRTSSSAGTAGRVRSLLSRAAQAGQVDAAVDLAFLLESGADDGPKDPAEAERLYLKASEANHPVALNNLAVMLLEGRAPTLGGVPGADAVARELLTRASRVRASGAALNNLGVCAEDGIGGAPSEEDVVAFFRDASAHGSLAGAGNWGVCLARRGQAVEAKEALWRATQGLAGRKGDLLYTLALLMERDAEWEAVPGKGAAESSRAGYSASMLAAVKIYERAAADGDHRAMARLAQHFLDAGQTERALGLLEQACLAGNGEALALLGRLCLERSPLVEWPKGGGPGGGVAEAVGWQVLGVAATRGSRTALDAMRAIGTTIVVQ